MDLLTNPWVMGIGGGIISSLFVFFVTRFFFIKLENRKYWQRVERADREILSSIKPLIIEKKAPSKEIVQSITFSVSKKYGVEEKDLYTENSLVNDLIYEIMGNSFLSADQKTDFCTFVRNLSEENLRSRSEAVYLSPQDALSPDYISSLFAVISFVLVAVATFVIAGTGSERILSPVNSVLLLCGVTFVPVVVVAFSYLVTLGRRIGNKKATN